MEVNTNSSTSSQPGPIRNRPHDKHYSRKPETDDISEIRQHLAKRYDLDDDPLHALPEKCFSRPGWQIESLCSLKKHLNSVKSRLNNYDLEKWHAHTQYTNLAGFVISTVRQFKPELLTQAWCKFYDILESFPVVPATAVESGVLNTIHLCEAPGAFIASLNHHLTLNFPNMRWQWRASTLNPYYEGNPLQRMINDDRFLMKTLDNWLFGDDYTGNICQKSNLENLKQTTDCMGPIHLVTADGSFDCADDPAEQEGKVVPLLYCEVVSALSILSAGGSFVLKLFTIFEDHTICLLYLLRCAFKKMTVYKPIVSKEGNSELYVVCLGFLGRTSCQSVLNEMSAKMDEANVGPPMFGKDDIDDFFLCEIERCATFFTGIQIRVIERNIKLFEDFPTTEQQTILRIKRRIADLFVENCCIRPLPDDGYLIGKQSYYKRGLHFSPRDESGTFAERQYLKENDSSAMVELYKVKLEKMHFFWPTADQGILWLDGNQLQAEGYSAEVSVRRGKPFKTILSSRFCPGSLLNIFNDVIKNTTVVNSYDFWSMSDSSFVHNRTVGLAYSEFKTVDVRDKPWITSYHAAQAESLRTLRPVLEELTEGNNLVFIGLPLLTQFNVGLVFLLALNFKKVGFASPRQVGNCIIFQDLISPDLKVLNRVLDDLEQDTENAPISLVNITAFGDQFLTTIILLNQVLLRKTSSVLAWNY